MKITITREQLKSKVYPAATLNNSITPIEARAVAQLLYSILKQNNQQDRKDETK